MTVTPAFTGVSPYLHYPDGDAAAQWLTRVLGFGPARSVRGPDGSWAEGEVAIGPGRVDISGAAAPGPGSGAGAGALLIVGVDDVDAQYRRIRAAGAQLDPPKDEAYGPRTCHVTDPWGYQWYFWQGHAFFPPES
jgi:uncharacterized glyoxalase superfamily protein PhnB